MKLMKRGMVVVLLISLLLISTALSEEEAATETQPVIVEPDDTTNQFTSILSLIADKVTVFIGDIINIEATLKYENSTTAGFAEGQQRRPLGVPKHVLAKVFNEDKLNYDRAYAQEYLELRHNFSDKPYKNITADREDFTLSMRNRLDDVRGLNINNSKFAVHVVYCDQFEKFCKFRVNGVLAPRLYFNDVVDVGKLHDFDLDGKYALKVNSAKFDQCDNQRFCHFGYEGYDLVDVTLERKR